MAKDASRKFHFWAIPFAVALVPVTAALFDRQPAANYGGDGVEIDCSSERSQMTIFPPAREFPSDTAFEVKIVRPVELYELEDQAAHRAVRHTSAKTEAALVTLVEPTPAVGPHSSVKLHFVGSCVNPQDLLPERKGVVFGSASVGDYGIATISARVGQKAFRSQE